jgi:PAS domain S-box-containing protein
LIWISDQEKRCTYVNKRWLDFTGRHAESELGNGWSQGIHPDDLKRSLATYSDNIDRRKEFTAEYRLRRHDGEYRWMCATGVPLFDGNGAFAGYIVSCFDITDVRLAEESLARVNAGLIEAHEQERKRIAKELHDDIGSSLAMLAIDILRAGSGPKSPDNQDIYEEMQHLASKVSRLSHQLHSPMLEYVGLAKAIETECREFSRESGLQVSCCCRDVPAKLDPAVALTVLRVVQEALGNAAKHSGAPGVTVALSSISTCLNLEVSDEGVGFDALTPGEPVQGFGLTGIRERGRLVGGAFEIWSKPGKGTRIKCRVPLARSEAVGA